MTYVYFAQRVSGGPIKVGVSRNPEQRMKQLRRQYGVQIRLIAQLPGDIWRERAIHHGLRHWHVTGEWFDESCPVLRVLHPYMVPKVDPDQFVVGLA